MMPHDNPLTLVLFLAALSLLPFVFVMATSFLKMIVVFSILRNAIGLAQIPPTMVLTGLALILTCYVMAPTGTRMYHAAAEHAPPLRVLSSGSPEQLVQLVDRAKEPLREFLLKHSSTDDRKTYLSLAQRVATKEKQPSWVSSERDFLVVLPAFVVGQLAQAFRIGFLVFVPFLVLDLLVANILLALGMHMLSPTTISLPFKLLLFVVVNGWQLVTEGLVLSFM